MTTDRRCPYRLSAPCILDPEDPFTMSTLDTPVASLPGVSLSLGQLLQTLHAQGRLRPLVVEALAGRLVQQQARQAGLSITGEDLQATADAFRRAHALPTPTATPAY